MKHIKDENNITMGFEFEEGEEFYDWAFFAINMLDEKINHIAENLEFLIDQINYK